MSNPHASGRVSFDFSGSLELARVLWNLADLIVSAQSTRSVAAEAALRQWEGRFGTEFSIRVSDEKDRTVAIAVGLRTEAHGWAESWAKAMNEQNRRNRAARVAEVRLQRSFWERNLGDRIFGDDSESQVRALPYSSVPQAPNFAPTQTEVSF
jgi:hypothetical protein